VKGYLVPARQIAVSPIEVAGRIVELTVVEGKLFQEGDVLAKIDDTSYRTAAEEADAAVAAAESRLAAARDRLAELLPTSVRKIEFQQVEAELQEAEALKARAADDLKRYRGIPGTVAARELVQAEADYQTASARVERLKATLQILTEGPRKERIRTAEDEIRAAEAEVKAAQARQTQANWRLQNCIITAPITGTVLSKKTEIGNLVNPLAFNASSGSVCDIADLTDLEADLEIPERDIGKLVVGQPCRIKADAFPDRIYTGFLDRIMPIANRAKSIVNVRVKVKLPDGEVPGTYLKPEMGAVVSFLPAT
jgi:multidrug resistance efflux pump